MLEVVDEYGYERGAIGQSVHAIIDVLRDRDVILESITFDDSVLEQTRYAALGLLIYNHQLYSAKEAIAIIEKYLNAFPNSEYGDVLIEIRAIIKEFGSVSFY